ASASRPPSPLGLRSHRPGLGDQGHRLSRSCGGAGRVRARGPAPVLPGSGVRCRSLLLPGACRDLSSLVTVCSDQRALSHASDQRTDAQRVEGSNVMSRRTGTRVRRTILPTFLIAALIAVPVPVAGMSRTLASASASRPGADAASSVAAVASPRVSVPDYVVGESDGTVDVSVSLDAPGINTVTVPYQTETGTADANDFVIVAGGSMVFSPGETTRVVRIEIKNDLIAEGVQSFVLHLLSATGGTMAKALGRVTIIDDDTLVGSPRLVVRDVTVDEKAGTA